MEQEYEAEIERHPRHIEKCHRTGACKEGADGVNVAHRLQRFSARSAVQRQPHDGVMRFDRELAVNAAGETDKNLAANDLKRALEDIQHSRQDRESDKRWYAPA